MIDSALKATYKYYCMYSYVFIEYVYESFEYSISKFYIHWSIEIFSRRRPMTFRFLLPVSCFRAKFVKQHDKKLTTAGFTFYGLMRDVDGNKTKRHPSGFDQTCRESGMVKQSPIM